jgi:hypothetical protein
MDVLQSQLVESRKAQDRQLFIELLVKVSKTFSSEFFIRYFSSMIFQISKEREMAVVITFLTNIKEIRDAYGVNNN